MALFVLVDYKSIKVVREVLDCWNKFTVFYRSYDNMHKDAKNATTIFSICLTWPVIEQSIATISNSFWKLGSCSITVDIYHASDMA